jgi:organic radical activating enzyme|tara:strand:+ start:1978 stop:4428 length:2451 start_codon:yes stop_codon:yes gene_type:complete
LKYKIESFTHEEKIDLTERYSEWAQERNIEWVEKEYNRTVKSTNNGTEIDLRANEYDFIENYAQKMYVFEKLKDCHMHSSPYIDSRIGEHKLESFNDEISQRITLEEMENNFNSDFINNRIKKIDFESFYNELQVRQKLKDCEEHTTPYVEKRMLDFSLDNMDDELVHRIKLEECEKINTSFVQKRIKRYIGKIHPDIEMTKRQILFESEKHTTRYVTERLKEYQPKEYRIDNHEDLYEDLQWRQDLEQCALHQSSFIDQNLKFYKGRGVEILSPTHELESRLTLEECEKFNTDYISRETARLKDEYLIRDPQEELKHRMNLSFFENNVKDKEKIANKDTFWDMISVHGLENMKVLKDELNEVGEGFCLAKWNQVSILLQTGQTHSCHHPRPHVVPLDELERNPSALHNTNFKKQQRKTMLKGGKPKECDYCWNVEDANPDAFSDRIMKSGEAWAFPYFDKIKKSDPSENTNPTYVEVSFSNQCNMSCGYCDVKSSSNWQHEIKTQGHYPTSGMYNNTEWMERDGIVPIPHSKPNPYRDAFWKWWPDLYPTLHTFRITGGEPILSKDTFKVLDYIIDNPNLNPMLEMSVNTNLCAPQDMVEEFIDKVKYITEKDLVWNFALFTSIESWGKQAEYMRDGMDTERFWNNLDMFLTKCQKPEATIMATYNLTSVPTYHEVIKKVFELKKKHYNGKRYRHYAVILDTAYLRHPEFLQVRLLSTHWIDKIREDVKFMESLSEEKYTHIYGHGHGGFYDFEREKLRRVLDWVDAPIDDIKWLMKMRRDFVLFIDEFDKRRGKNFLQTFPEMEDFYYSCKKLI